MSFPHCWCGLNAPSKVQRADRFLYVRNGYAHNRRQRVDMWEGCAVLGDGFISVDKGKVVEEMCEGGVVEYSEKVQGIKE